ncbi:MAG: protein-L-isoaspartate(D-aspartate) O-methyltransferase [Pseudomonadales bacterium]|nr:protein-L-isoaspartate(D-aspartate) O-methyltransferase [Pseudomonadales bacterium]
MQQLIEAIREDARETAAYTGRSEIDPRVLAAITRVPRDRFVPSAEADRALLDRPLPIGFGQTISQPFIVALMTDLLALQAGDRVLEVGTGSGYQAAVLAELGVRVRSLEIIPELASRAEALLAELGYAQVEVRVGDGWFGWPDAGPFDGIIVTAVATDVSPHLLAQLAPDGRMVLPLGAPGGFQELLLITREPDGQLSRRSVLPVQFVPLTGAH